MTDPAHRPVGTTANPHSLLVIGSGPAGVSAARSYLEAGGAGPVRILTADADPPYQRPPLSKEALSDPARSPQGQSPLEGEDALDGIEVVTGARVAAVDVLEHTARVAAVEHVWERLVLAPGSHPLPFPVADPDADVHHLRTLEDARRLHAAAGHARSAIVVGSGFIGCEAAASLARRGVRTTVLTPEDGPQLERLGPRASRGSWTGSQS